MRKIKFKAKYEGDGMTWIYGDLIHKRTNKDCIIIQEENGCGFDCISETVCQFTGYLDEDRNEIYEGDIIEEEGTKRRFIVVFDDGGFRLATEKQKEYLDNGLHPFSDDYRELLSLNSYLMSAPYHIVGHI